jgi:capsular exopolysaccharide synthesis family protein
MSTQLSPYHISPSGPPLPPTYVRDERNLFSGEINFKEYWGVIRKHRMLILSLIFGSVVIVLAWRFTRTPQYEATSTILIQPQTPQVMTGAKNFNDNQSNYSGDYDYYRTQFDLLKSESLATRVIEDFGLETNPVFNPAGQRGGFFSSAIGYVGDELASLAGSENDASAPAQSRGTDAVAPSVVKAYLERLTVEPVRGTRLVVVGFTTPDRELSARIANAHVQTYIRQGLELHAQTGRHVEEFLQQKLGELRDKVEKSEAALNAYRRGRGIVTLEGADGKSGTTSPLMQRLTQLNTQLTAAASKRITLETQHQMIARGEYDSLPEVISNQVIQSLKEQVAQLAMQYAAMSNRFNPGYHKLDDLGARLEASRKALNHESKKVAESVDADYQAAVANEAKVGQEIDAVKAQTLALNDASLQEAVLAREVDANRQLYRSVLERMNEISVASEVPASNVSIVDRAKAPTSPTGPRLVLLLAFCIAGSGLVGVALAFFLESLDDTFKTGDEVPRYLGLPSLGVIPDFNKLDGGRQPYAYLPSRLRSGKDAPVRALEVSGEKGELLVSHGSFSTAAEVYRAIRAAVMFSRAGGAPKSILITSSTSGEGKTITAVNMATAFAQTGARTVLVDTDFRRSRCHEILEIDPVLGLSEVLVRQCELADAVVQTGVPGLSFICSGKLPPNPSELLASPEMRTMIEELAETYNYVVMDSAPVMPVSDSVGLSTMVEAVLVVAGNDTSRKLVRETCQRLGNVGARMVGVILNRVDVMNNSSYLYGHYSYYYSYKPRKDREPADGRPESDSVSPK